MGGERSYTVLLIHRVVCTHEIVLYNKGGVAAAAAAAVVSVLVDVELV